MRYIRVYENWKEETEPLTLEEKGRLIDSLIEYLRTGQERQPEGNERFIYPHFIQDIKQGLETRKRKKERKREARS